MTSTTYIDIPYKAELQTSSGASSPNASIFNYKPRRSLWRIWMRLSRYQRYLLFVIVLITIGLLVNFLGASDPTNLRLGRNQNVEVILPNPPIQNQAHDADAIEANFPESNAIVDESSLEFKRSAIKAACVHAWRGYKMFAWGHDHLLPISKKFDDWFGLGLTILDAIDTLYIMDLKEEYGEARTFVAEDLNFDKNKDVNFFETSIRVLGGLLGAHTVTKDKLFLEKAKDIGNRLLPAFNSRSRIPFSDVNIGTGSAHGPNWAQDSTVSEVSSVQLEFRTLSRLTGDPMFEEKAFNVSKHLHSLPKENHLVPMFISTDSGRFGNDQTITLGARADSYYEYLLKQWIQMGMKEDFLKEDYLKAIESVRDNLTRRSSPNGLLFVGELKNRKFSPKMDHLVCYLPGTLTLGHFVGNLPRWHLDMAVELMRTCVAMYSTTQTGLSPEIAYFNLARNGDKDIIIKSNDAHNLLRPETIESLWYLHYFTRNETYRNWAWDIFLAFEEHTKVPSGGYTSIGNVLNKQFTRPRDKMESFFLGETLKYWYLIFSSAQQQEKYSPKSYVYNTEAHLLPIFNDEHPK